MKLLQYNLNAIYYTTYVVKPGETLKQIAKEQLHDENLTPTIRSVVNNVPQNNAISPVQNITGWTLLLPPVPDSFLSKHPNAQQQIKKYYDQAMSGAITAEQYYEFRKAILASL